MVKLKNLEENYEDQFENIKIMIEDENKYLKNEFSTEIDKKLQNSSDIFHEKIEEITEILKNFHSELDVEELELQSLKAKTDPGNDPIILTKNEEKPQISVEYKEKPQISSELKEKPEISEEFQEKAYKKSNTLTGFKARLANIENQITFLRQNQENIKKVSEVIEKPEKKKKLPKKEKKTETILEIRKEIDEKLNSALRDFNKFKRDTLIAIEESENKQIERRESVNIGFEMKGLQSKLLSLGNQVEDMKKRHSMIDPNYSRLSVLSPILSPRLLENDSESSSEVLEEKNLENFKEIVEKLSYSVEKIKKTMPLIVFKSELEDILHSNSKKMLKN